MAAKKYDHKYGNQRDRKDRGESDRERLGPRQGTKHTALLRFEEEHGQEGNKNNQQRKENRGAYLLRRAHEDTAPFSSGQLSPVLFSCGDVFRQMPITVFYHHDSCIDENSDSERQPAEGHNVCA